MVCWTLLIIVVWVKGLVSDFVALDSLQEVLHHILPIPFRVVRAWHLYLLKSQERKGLVRILFLTALQPRATAENQKESINTAFHQSTGTPFTGLSRPVLWPWQPRKGRQLGSHVPAFGQRTEGVTLLILLLSTEPFMYLSANTEWAPIFPFCFSE